MPDKKQNTLYSLTTAELKIGIAKLPAVLVDKIKEYVATDMTQYYDYSGKTTAILGDTDFLQFLQSFGFSKEQIIRIRQAENNKLLNWSNRIAFNVPSLKPDINKVFEAGYTLDYALTSSLYHLRRCDGFHQKMQSHEFLHEDQAIPYSFLTRLYDTYVEYIKRPWSARTHIKDYEKALYKFVAIIYVYGRDNVRKQQSL